jgi:hypothetical protein
VRTLDGWGKVDTTVVAGAGRTTVADWLHLIPAEYFEMPGLHLTRPQVQRLWNLDELTSEAVLEALVDVRFLRRTHRGGYVRADS